MTTNPIYRCEEFEDQFSVYDAIEENDQADSAKTPDTSRLQILSDKTEEYDEGTKPPLPKPRPETKLQDQGRDYEGLKDEKPDHVYLQLLSEEP